MRRKFTVTLMAAGLATGALHWLSPSGAVAAYETATLDTDEDFLPDAVEWVVLTDVSNPDTDGDTVPDFVEVVEGGQPRHENAPLPPDQRLRVVITGPMPGSSDPRTWMHVFHRVITPATAAGAGATAIQSFDTWLERPEWPGVRFPLNVFAAGGLVYRERVTAHDGVWVQLSVPLVSEGVLKQVLPCTIYAETTVAGQALSSGMTLINLPAGISSIVPYDPGRFVIQTLSPIPAQPVVGYSNKVCVLELLEDTTGPAGTTYIVVAADCEDANDLECAPSCPSSVGWTITIPGGTGLIGGN
ncbi:MAG TPA: hypothetical protein ENI87_04400 [bacterium]|nr:hypothetical protein [bacterium]